MWLLTVYFNAVHICCPTGDVPSRGPTEEPGAVHWLSTHQRPSLLSGPGPPAAQSHVGCHTQLPGRVPEHPPTDPEPQPGTTSVPRLPVQLRRPWSPLRWVRPWPCSSAATGAPDPSISPIPLVFPVSSSRAQWQGPAGAAGLWFLSLPDGYHELQCL